MARGCEDKRVNEGESTDSKLVLGKEYYLFTPLLHNRLSV